MDLFALLSTVERQLLGIGAIELNILNAVTIFILLPDYQDALFTDLRADLAKTIEYV